MLRKNDSDVNKSNLTKAVRAAIPLMFMLQPVQAASRSISSSRVSTKHQISHSAKAAQPINKASGVNNPFSAFSSNTGKTSEVKSSSATQDFSFLDQVEYLPETEMALAGISGDTEGRKIFSRRANQTCAAGATYNGNGLKSLYYSSDSTCTVYYNDGTPNNVKTTSGCGAIKTACETSAPADTTPPAVSSITVSGSPNDNDASVTFSVDFDENANNVSTDDFTVSTASGTASGSVASVSASSGDPITVTVNSITGTGTIRLDLNASTNITDDAGNGNGTNGSVAAFNSGSSHTVDRDAPTISSVAVPSNATYASGENLDFTINTSEAVTVNTAGGTPSLGLTVGSTSRQAAYVSGSGSQALLFRYTLQAGESDSDGITVGSLSLNSGTLRDAASNDLTTTLNSVGSTSSVLVDAVSPTVSSVSVPSNATYVSGQNLDFTVNTSENVTVTTTGGTPQIALTIGSTTRQAVYQSGSGTSALVFRYVVQTGDLDSDGIAVGALSANGGSLKDAVGNDMTVTLNSVGSTSSVLVDAAVPTVTSVSVPANASYQAGQNLDFTVNTSENVTVTTTGGTPQIAVTIGSTTRQAVYQSGSGTSALLFRYTVQAGETDSDGIVVGALSANGGTLQDSAGNDMTVTLNSVGTTTSVLVDTTDPTISSVSAPSNATYSVGENLDFTINTSENIIVNTSGGTPSLAVTVGSTVRQATYQSGSGTSALVFRYTVQAGELDSDGVAVGALSLNSGTLQDAAGNDLNLTLNSIGLTTGVLVDAVVPTVASVSVPSNDTYIQGEDLTFTVNTSENITVNTTGGTPQLAIVIGSTTRQAVYQSGSGTSALVFTYTVQAGDADADGITVSSLSDNGGTLESGGGNDLLLTLNSVGTTTSVLVDAVAPAVTSVAVPSNGSYKSGEVLSFTVNTSENVTVNTTGGTPQLALTIGSTSRQATYQSGSGSQALVFSYTVQSGDADSDGIALGSLAANGGTLRDSAGNNMTLTLNSVGSTNNVLVDTSVPTINVSGGNTNPVDSATNVATNSNIVLDFSEAVILANGQTITLFDVTNSANREVFTASSTTAATGSSSGSISVGSGDITINPGQDLQAGTQYAIRFGGSSITDAAGNAVAAISDSTTYNFTTIPELAISVSPSTISEAAQTATYTVQLQDGNGNAFNADGNITMTTTISGTATGGGTDYNLSGTTSGNTSFQIDSGSASKTFTVTSVSDGSTEPLETVIASISSVSGNAMLSSTASATLSITENFPPVVSNLPATYTVTEDTPSNLNLSAVTFSDTDNSNLTITLAVNSGAISSPLGTSGGVTVSNSGTASMTLDGSTTDLNNYLDNANAIAFTPAKDATSNVTLTVTPNDSNNDGSAATSTISITPVNDNPSIVSTYNSTFDMTGSLSSSDTVFTEVDAGITMTATIDSGSWTNDASGGGNSSGDSIYVGTASVTTTTFAFDTAVKVNSLSQFVNGAANSGASTFTYTVTNGSGANVTETATNVASDVTISPTDWNSVSAFTVTNSGGQYNPGFDTLAYTGNLALPTVLAFTEETQGNVDLSDFTFTDVDSNSITVTLTASSGVFAAPADGASNSVTETLVNDQTITLVGSPSNISAYLDTASNVKYTPADNVSGNPADDVGGTTQTITMTANDGDGSNNVSIRTFNLNVTNTDDLPTISGTPTTSITAGSAYTFTPTASDQGDGDSLIFRIINKPSWATFSTANGALTGTPTSNDVGSYSDIEIYVDDAANSVALPSFSIEVTAGSSTPTPDPEPTTNSAPVINQGDSLQETIGAGASLSLSLTATDADGDNLSWSIGSQASNGSASVSAGNVSYTPSAGFTGNDSFVITVSDGQDSDSITINVTVGAVNRAPTISGTPTTSIKVAEAYQFVPTAADADGDTLTFSADNLPDWLSINTQTGVVSGTSGSADAGTYENIVISVSDGTLSASLAAFNIEVVNGNTKPEISGDALITKEDIAVPASLLLQDVDGDSLTYTLVATPDSGSVEFTASGLTYTPNDNFNGEDSFSIQANDGELDSNVASFTVNIEAVNDAPVAEDDNVTLDRLNNDTYTIDVIANDSDIDGDVISILGAKAAIGDVTVSNNQLLYQATENFSGSVELEYSIGDGNQDSSDTAKVTLTIAGIAGQGITITAPPVVNIDATGLFTRVTPGSATAQDSQGNVVPVKLSEPLQPLAPGSTTLYWQAGVGESQVTAQQQVNVAPLVSIGKDQVVVEGNSLSIPVILNGDSPVYPLTVSYTVSGTASSADHTLTDGSVTFAQGREETISFEVLVDNEAESEESIIISLDNSVNLGANNRSIITVSEQNVAPEITLTVSQSGEERLTVAQDQGEVTIASVVTDANPQDTVTKEWTADGLINTSNANDSFTFDPAALAVGVYQISLSASDNGSPALSNNSSVFVQVTNALTSLSEDVDTDGDLIPDAQEGYADEDGDGIPDYKDSISDCNVVPERAVEQTQFLVESEPGVCLRRGAIAALNESDGLEVIISQTSSATAKNGQSKTQAELDSVPEDADVNRIGRVIDFILYGLPEEGASYEMALPQNTPLSAGSVYRKYSAEKGWFTFVEDEHNKLFSTQGERGFCPPPGGEEWQPGLNEGHWCVQLMIQDGGPNDNDGEVNGSISDPGVIAILADQNQPPVVQDDSAETRINTPVTFSVLGNDSDPDNDPLTVTSVTANFGNAVINNDQSLTYTPESNFAGQDTLVYGVNDGNGGSNSATVNIMVNPNQLPVLADDTATVIEGQSVTIDVLANDSDADDDNLTVISATVSTGSVVVNADQTLTYTSVEGETGNVQIQYQVNDGFDTVSAIATVAVKAKPLDRVTTRNKGGGSMNLILLFVLLFIATERLSLKRIEE